jgi:hypothetical protein
MPGPTDRPGSNWAAAWAGADAHVHPDKGERDKGERQQQLTSLGLGLSETPRACGRPFAQSPPRAQLVTRDLLDLQKPHPGARYEPPELSCDSFCTPPSHSQMVRPTQWLSLRVHEDPEHTLARVVAMRTPRSRMPSSCRSALTCGNAAGRSVKPLAIVLVLQA